MSSIPQRKESTSETGESQFLSERKSSNEGICLSGFADIRLHNSRISVHAFVRA